MRRPAGGDEVPQGGGEAAVDGRPPSAAHHLVFQLPPVEALEGHSARGKLPEDDPEAVHVHQLRVLLLQEDLGGHVAHAACLAGQLVGFQHGRALLYGNHQSEVKYLQHTIFRESDILRLQV